jgi:hypothetical protein
MTVAVVLDQIETLELQEKWGVVTGVRRKAIVTGLTGTTWEILYDVLDQAGLPSFGSFLDDARGAHLALTDRNVQMVDLDKAEVELIYGTFNDRGQQLGVDYGITYRPAAGKMTASVVQKRVNFYRENGVGPKQLILLHHTYPKDDPDYGGKTVPQTGEIDVNLPGHNFTIEGVRAAVAPWNIGKALVGAINDSVWLGEAKHSWMCTSVSWEFRGAGMYFMSFEFQHDPDTWNPGAVFIDERTGRPPENLLPGIGYKSIRYHKEANFVRELGFFVVGPAQ